ncbi:MAG: hypothetical protein PHP30_06305 [Bacteroidales bacterium]|nr:hypothetical protein [Bacteroidales bacterium]MDD2424788.1 hypothetical protein [Bacteroidales bacterium]MDD3989686.1 hypothetical protein [Bacteroidales bacterium]MDD4638193.1 hypothetical protein [Bacteroidales bacterium]
MINSKFITRFVLLSVYLLISCSREDSPPTVTTTFHYGLDSIEFVYEPLNHKEIKVYYYIPESGSMKNMPILFAFHGADRNGIYQIDTWKSIADERKIMVFAPQFSQPLSESDRKRFNSNEYQLGGVTTSGSYYSPVQEDKWTFSVIEELFDHIKEATGSSQATYDMWGHSAGGQWTHRYVLFKPNARLRMAVVSNSGVFTVPDVLGISDGSAIYSFPYSLKGTTMIDSDVRRYFTKNMVIHTGMADLATTTQQDPYLSVTAGSKAQGANRNQRSLFFYNYCRQIAEDKGWEFNWSLVEVPNVGHSSRRMVQTYNVGAADILY